MKKKLIHHQPNNLKNILLDNESRSVYQHLILSGAKESSIPMKTGLWNWKTGQIVLDNQSRSHSDLLCCKVEVTRNDAYWYGFSFYSGIEEGFLPNEVVVFHGSSIGYAIPSWILPIFEHALDNLFSGSVYSVKAIAENSCAFPEENEEDFYL